MESLHSHNFIVVIVLFCEPLKIIFAPELDLMMNLHLASSDAQ